MTSVVNRSLQDVIASRADQRLVLRILAIFSGAMLLSLFCIALHMQYTLDRQGRAALVAMEQFLDQSVRQLGPVAQSAPRCEPADVTTLRRQLFGFAQAKELGLFDAQFRLYCVSNEGPVDIQLYTRTRQRMLDNQGVTLSLAKAKVSDARVLFIYARQPDSGMGANMLLPPTVLDQIVRQSLFGFDVAADENSASAFQWQVDVIGRPVEARLAAQAHWPEMRQAFTSERYPLNLTLHGSVAWQLGFLWRDSWIGLLLGSFGAFLFIYRTHLRLKNNGLEAALERAIVNRELYLCYQPIMDFERQQAVGYEALLRWQHPLQGHISPGIFIPLAEQLDLIVPITDLVLDDVMAFVSQHERALGDSYISVNISRQHLLKHDLASNIEQRCQSLPALREHLLLELTEENAFSESQLATALGQLERLHASGVKLAVDDFGTGYSGLDFIRRYPFDVLKIDQAFVKGVGREATAQPLLETMIRLSRQLGMDVIAEGVERPEQAQLLHLLGVNLMQGYLFARPMPQAQVVPWLAAPAPDYPADFVVSSVTVSAEKTSSPVHH